MRKLYCEDDERLARIISDLMKQRENNKTRVKAWKRVKRVSKKDGSDFSTFSKNFTGCKVLKSKYGLIPDELELNIFERSECGEWVDDFIRNVTTDIKGFDPSRVEKIPCIVPFVRLTPDEIMNEIEKKIERYEKRALELDQIIREAPAHYEAYKEAYNALYEVVSSLPDSFVYAFEREHHL